VHKSTKSQKVNPKVNWSNLLTSQLRRAPTTEPKWHFWTFLGAGDLMGKLFSRVFDPKITFSKPKALI
jgi:hypothetical protein